jgi:hypothetical protein
MTPDTFATRSLRPRDQLGAWQEWYQPVFNVVPTVPTGNGFAGEPQLLNLGSLVISQTTAPPARVTRAKSHLRRDPSDHWVLSFCVRGAHLTKSADMEVEVPPRVPFLWPLGQELSYERTHVDRVQYVLTRDALRDIAALLDVTCGSVLDTSLAAYSATI